MIALLLLLILAEEPEEAAGAALRAFESGDSAALQAVAGARDPDPWAVADALCAQGRADAAKAVAARVGADREPLEAYVGAFGETPADRESRALLLALAKEQDPARIAAATEGLPAPRTVVDLRLRSRRAQALMRLGRWDDALLTVRATLDTGLRLGWSAHRRGAALRLAYATLRKGDLEGGAKLLAEALDLARAAPDEEELARALFVGGSGVAELDPSRAQPLLEEAATIHRARGEPAKAGQAIEILGVQFLQREELDAALRHIRRASDLYRQAGDLALATRSLQPLAGKLLSAGRLEEAEGIAGEALSHLREAGREEGRAEFLDILAGAAGARRDWPAMARLYGECAEAFRAAGDAAAVVGAMLQRTTALRCLGELRAASEACTAARALLDALPDGSPRRRLAGELGAALLVLERGTEAIRLLEIARDDALLPPAEPSLKPSLIRLAANFENLIARALLRAGRSAEALASARRLLRLVRPAGEPAMLAMAYGVLADSLWRSGAWADAVEASQQSLEQARRTGDERKVAEALAHLGGVRLSLRDHENAASLLSEAVGILRRLEDPLALSRPLSRLASCVSALGRFEEALSALDESAAAARAGRWLELESTATNERGNVLGAMGREREAEESYRRALALSREAGDEGGEAVALGNLALALLRRGEAKEASDSARRAMELAEKSSDSLLGRTTSVAAAVEWGCGRRAEAIALFRRSVGLLLSPLDRLGEEEGARARAGEFRPLRGGLEASIEAGSPEDAFFFLEANGARGLLAALGGRDSIRERIVPEEIRALEGAALERRQRAAAGVDRALETGNRSELKHWRTELRAAEADLAGVLERMQRDARRNAQIYCPSPPALAEVRRWLRPGDALVVVGEGYEVHQALVVTGEETRFAVLPVPPGGPPDALDAVAPALAEPLHLADAKVTRILLSAPAPLAQVPWCLAFPGKEIAYLPSATIWGVLRAQAPAKGTEVLAFGDPDAGRGLSRLPASAEEAKEIGNRVFVGAEATEEAFRSALATPWRAIHFACHGAIREDQPLFSALALTPEDADDGLLGAGEVLGAQVRTDLVTLSACETARGRGYRGEGILGLTRAFLFAGSPRVIVSLWRVDDEATRALMTTFYALWRPGTVSAAAALRSAQESVASQERWRDPRFWAAWQLWGLPD